MRSGLAIAVVDFEGKAMITANLKAQSFRGIDPLPVLLQQASTWIANLSDEVTVWDVVVSVDDNSIFIYFDDSDESDD